MCSQLLEWIAQVMPWLEDRTGETTLQDAQVSHVISHDSHVISL